MYSVSLISIASLSQLNDPRDNPKMRWCRYFLTVVKLILTFAFVEAIEKRYTKEDICSETNNTLEEVNACPENESALNKRSQAKMCETYPKCQGETLFYHCVRINEHTLVEVCAPNHTVIGKHCPVFEKGLGRVVDDYNSYCSKCPTGYDSYHAPIYSECVQTRKVSTFQTFTSQNVEDVDTSGSSPPMVNTSVGTETDGNLAESDKKSMNATQQTMLEEYTVIILGIILPICSMLLCALGIYVYRKRKRAYSSISPDSPKHSKFQNHNKSNKSSA